MLFIFLSWLLLLVFFTTLITAEFFPSFGSNISVFGFVDRLWLATLGFFPLVGLMLVVIFGAFAWGTL